MRVALAVAFVVALGGALLVGNSSRSSQGAPVTPPARERAAAAQPVAPATRPEPTPPAATCRAGTIVGMRNARTAHAAEARRAVVALTTPGGAAISRFPRINANGVPTVFGVLAARLDAECAPAWYRVQLPLRPNGQTGWVRARDVRVTTVDTRIVVDLSDRRVTLFKKGQRVFEATAAIGKPGTPTPTGEYYVNQRLLAADPNGPFGPGGVGISAFAPTLEDWVQGGPIAIHGTNVPQLLGQAVSYGCVRVRNGDLLRLMDLALEGTPVVIRA